MKERRSSNLNLWSGLACGMAGMYLLDPEMGKRRRSMLRDKAVHGLHVARDGADKAGRDLQHRSKGTVIELWHRVRGENVPDEILVERVRSALGRAVSHPGAIDVSAEDGTVTLRGLVLDNEADDLIAEVSAVRGVHGIENQLDIRKFGDSVSSLQGGRPRFGRRPDILQENWAPATRFLVGATGSAITVAGLRRGGFTGSLMAGLGSALLIRGLTNIEAKRLVGGGGRRAIELQKTINIHAPVDQVFRLWEKPENFPRILQHIREVRSLGENRYHWVVDGPAGTSLGWDAEIVQDHPNRLITWRSIPGSLVRNAGIVRFDENSGGGTRVQIFISYNPPGGAIGHAVATLLGNNPKQMMDDDLVRMKSLMEEGKTTAHGERVRKEDLAV